MIGREACCSALITTTLAALVVVMASISLSGQRTKDDGTDLQFHKFQPNVAPDIAVAADSKQSMTHGIGVTAAEQAQTLQQDKAARTPAQRKIDSNLIYTTRMLAGKPVANGVPYLYTGVDLDANNNLVVDMVAKVTEQLLQQLSAAGAQVLYTNANLRGM